MNYNITIHVDIYLPSSISNNMANNKNCKPIEQLLVKIHNYSMDTVRRISQFDSLRSKKSISVLQGDSTKINIFNKLKNAPFGNRKIDGIYTSPPYVG